MNTNTPMNNTKIDPNKINVPSGIATKKGEPAVKQPEPIGGPQARVRPSADRHAEEV
jgi:hypothetical protein